MKKLITAALTAMLSIPLIAAGAQAASRTAEINAALADNSEIHILYNDRMVKYEDVKPINNQDRIMIPFRAALENMGAEVGYDDGQRLVSATKGNTSISFTLMDDTIYINNNGEQSTMTMDVPMIIVSDRTLVPIRFMSEAFGMQVGWDGDTQTVVIMDYDSYFEELKTAAPNITKLSEIQPNHLNKSNLEFEAAVYSTLDESQQYLMASGKSERRIKDNNTESDITLNLDNGSISFKNAELTMLSRESKLYVKSDVFKQIAAVLNDDTLNENTNFDNVWFTIDSKKLLKNLGMNDEALNMFNAGLQLGSSAGIDDLIKSNITTEGEAVLENALSLATQMDIYEGMDSHISVNVSESGGYDISMDVQPLTFIEILNNTIGSDMTDEEKDALAASISYAIAADIHNDGKTQTAEAFADMNLFADSGDYVLQLWVKDSSTADSNVKIDELPRNTIDITDSITTLLKLK